MDKLDGVC